jgi:hypothetical protein
LCEGALSAQASDCSSSAAARAANLMFFMWVSATIS